MCWHRSPCGAAAPWQCPDPPGAESQGQAHTAQGPKEGHDRCTDPSWSCTLAQPLGTAQAALLSGAHPHQDLSLGDSLPFRPGLPLLPPSTTTLRCSSPCSATNSQNHSYKSSRVSWSPSSCDSSRFPWCPAAVCTYFTLLSLHCGRRLRVSHGFPVLQLFPGRIQKWLITMYKLSTARQTDQQSTWPLVPATLPRTAPSLPLSDAEPASSMLGPAD